MSDKPEQMGRDSLSPAERDRIELALEASGQAGGKLQRFLTGERRDSPHGESEKKKAERRYQTMLDMLLATPTYAQLYYQVQDTINQAQSAVDRALLAIKQRLEESERKLKQMREHAATLPDGTKVFKSVQDGQIYTEDGRRLSEEEARHVQFPEHAPNLEDYEKAKAERDHARRQAEDVGDYQRDVLDPAKKRMEDKDHPPSAEELKELDKRIKADMPEIVKTQLHDKELAAHSARPSSSLSAAHEIEKTELNVPNMRESFDQARMDIPDLGSGPKNAPSPAKTMPS